ncbi:MAG: RNA polymerase sigma factor [Acidobacteriaceae bacterium]|nr:RNA polymerase sigma factor [Acidobacteriaceae bacterium]
MRLNPAQQSTQHEMYEQAAADYGAALARLACGYEADAEKRRDLLQEVHLALWRSFGTFDERCSMRTWIYRVAHNAATSYVLRQKRARPQAMVSLEELEWKPEDADREMEANRREQLGKLTELIHRLKPLDRQVILSYLEGLNATDIGELTGLSARNVATKIHRIKNILSRQFHEEARHAE